MIGKTGLPQCKLNIIIIVILHSNKLAANVFAKLKIVIKKDTALFAIWLISFCEQGSPDLGAL